MYTAGVRSRPSSLAHVAFVLAVAGALACGGKGESASTAPAPGGPSSPAQIEAAAPAVAAVKAGDFERAGALAEDVLGRDRGNAYAAAARALSRYQRGMHELRDEAFAVLEGADRAKGFDHARMRAALEATAGALAAADAELAVAAMDPAFALELCLACWERDWNHSGEVDENDRRLFQIEIDAQGNELPEGDPRRTPRFRFDVGDVHWARAMVTFQRAAFELVLAYRWTELDKLLGSLWSGRVSVIVIHLEDETRVEAARGLILAGLEHADRSRRAYLAETDDEREWVPNPRQQDHPLPLPVDEALYEVWHGVLGDVGRLVAGEEALSVSELAQLGDHQWVDPPRGYIDVGRMLAEPKDIVLDFDAIEREFEAAGGDERRAAEGMLTAMLGDYYVQEGNTSPLVGRLARMKREMERGEDTFERKLRYLLWLN